MATPDEAVAAIRKAAQDYGDEHTVIGRPADVGAVRWVGQLLGWEWPQDYVAILSKHNGVEVRFAILYAFLKSFEMFLLFREEWHEPRPFWPVADDECGNYWALDLGRMESGGNACPVVFFDHGQSIAEPVEELESYSAFVVRLMNEQMANDKV